MVRNLARNLELGRNPEIAHSWNFCTKSQNVTPRAAPFFGHIGGWFQFPQDGLRERFGSRVAWSLLIFIWYLDDVVLVSLSFLIDFSLSWLLLCWLACLRPSWFAACWSICWLMLWWYVGLLLCWFEVYSLFSLFCFFRWEGIREWEAKLFRHFSNFG